MINEFKYKFKFFMGSTCVLSVVHYSTNWPLESKQDIFFQEKNISIFIRETKNGKESAFCSEKSSLDLEIIFIWKLCANVENCIFPLKHFCLCLLHVSATFSHLWYATIPIFFLKKNNRFWPVICWCTIGPRNLFQPNKKKSIERI